MSHILTSKGSSVPAFMLQAVTWGGQVSSWVTKASNFICCHDRSRQKALSRWTQESASLLRAVRFFFCLLRRSRHVIKRSCGRRVIKGVEVFVSDR